jgi:hypothetical protein
MGSRDSRNLLLALLAQPDAVSGDDQLPLLRHAQDGALADTDLIAQVGLEGHGSASDEAGEILSHGMVPCGL